MKRETARKLMPLIQAYVDGKEIEYYDTNFNEWKMCVGSPSFNDTDDYRIKPEPTLYYLVPHTAFLTQQEAMNYCEKHKYPYTTIKKVQEV